MQTERRNPIRAGIALVAMLAGLFAIPQAQAQSLVHERASTVWGHTYAGPPTQSLGSVDSGGAHLQKQSTFIVTYNNFPTWARNDVQAAIDVWSENFASTVPITIDATWGRSATSGVLGSAGQEIISPDLPVPQMRPSGIPRHWQMHWQVMTSIRTAPR